jgi:hypothetical protein
MAASGFRSRPEIARGSRPRERKSISTSLADFPIHCYGMLIDNSDILEKEAMSFVPPTVGVRVMRPFTCP